MTGKARSVEEQPNYFGTDRVRSTLKVRTARGAAFTAAAQVIKFALTLTSTVILARLLAPADYGLLAMAAVFTGFIGIFNNLGLSAATVQRPQIRHEDVSSLFWINAAAGAFLTLVTLCFSPAVAWFYGEPRLALIIVLLSPVFLMAGFAAQHHALLTRQMHFGSIASIEVASTAAGIAAGVGSALLGLGVYSLVAIQLATTLSATSLYWWLCRWRPALHLDLAGVRSMLAFGGNLTAFNVVNYFARNADNLLIGRYHGPRELGLYSRAYNILLFPLNQVLIPFSSVAVPALSRLTGSPEQFRSVFQRMLATVCLLTAPIAAYTIACSDWLIEILLGRQWKASADIFAWLGALAFIQPVSGTTGWVFVAQGRAGEQFRAGLVNSALSVAAFFLGLPWGGAGVAAAYTLSIMIRAPIVFWFTGRRGAVPTIDFYRIPAPFLTAATGSMVIALALRRLTSLEPAAGAASALLLIGVTNALLLATLPSGRQAMWSFITMLRDLLKR